MIVPVVLGAALSVICLAMLASPWPFVAPFVVLGVAGLALLNRRPAWGLLGIVALVPFEGLSKDSGFSAAKLLGASLILLLVIKVLMRQLPPGLLRSNLWRPLGFFLLCLFLNLLYSEYLMVSLDALRELAIGMVLFPVALLVGRQANLLMLCRLISISVAITCLIALYSSKYQVGGRAIGLLEDANYFALLIAVAVPPAILLALRAPYWPLRFFWIGVVLVLMSGMTKTDSRSGLLVVLFTCMICAWHHRVALQRLRPKHLGFVMLAAALIIPVGIMVMPADYIARIASLSSLKSGATSEDASLGRRASYVLVGGDMIREKPLLGSGLGTFPIHYAQTGYAAAFSMGLNEPDLFRRAHDTYLELFSELGIPAGLLFVTLIIMGLRNFQQASAAWLARGNRPAADLAMHLGLSFLALAVFLVFLSAANHKYLWVLLGLSSVLRQQAEALVEPAEAKP